MTPVRQHLPARHLLFPTVVLACAMALLLGSAVVAKDLPDDHMQWPPKVFRSAYRLIASPAERAALDTLSGEALQRYLDLFWKQRDPTPTTERNEFKEQFNDRVAFAATRFSTKAQPEPWDRRGEFFIRLGPPDEIIDSLFDAYYQKWYYFHHNLKFMFVGGAEGLDLRPFVDHSGRVQALPDFYEYKVRAESKGVVYNPPIGEYHLELSLDWYPFRRRDGNYDVYVACAVPMKSVAKKRRDRTAQLDYTTRVVAFDSVLQLQWSDSAHIERLLDVVPKDALAQTQWRSVLSPGFYVLAAELDDGFSKKRAVGAFDRWLVPYEQAVELDLSPLVVAAEVRDARADSGPFVRNGKEIIPMPGRVFRHDQAVAFYHEVYNLTPGADGQFRYRVEYALYDERRQHRRILTSQDFASAEGETFQAGSIATDRFEKGEYILEALTTDLVGGITKTALAGLKID